MELGKTEFRKISELALASCGINLHEGKKELVKARLSKRLKALGLPGFEEYVRHLELDPTRNELSAMVECLTTNKTSFFREPDQFRFLRQQIIPQLKARGGSMRFWSAGCSSGEEAYSLAIVLREAVSESGMLNARVLATDISARMLAIARQGIYGEEVLKDVPEHLLRRHFTPVLSGTGRGYRVADHVRAMVHPARLNLIEPWPMTGPFDAIYCRNVMIYFDEATRQQLVERFWRLLAPGGHLFLGRSENLMALLHEFKYVEPAVYVK